MKVININCIFSDLGNDKLIRLEWGWFGELLRFFDKVLKLQDK